MKRIFKEFIAELEFSETLCTDDLKIIPVIATKSIENYTLPKMTLKEAISKGHVEITEMDDFALVGRVKVKNTSNFNVVIIEGEIIQGARQNRSVNTTVVLKPNETTILPVSCVEQGRWRAVSEKFDVSPDGCLPPSLKALNQNEVSKKSASFGVNDSNQTEIWEMIRKMNQKLNCDSLTDSLLDAFHSYKEHFVSNNYQKLINEQDNQVGFLAFIRDGFAGGEIFGQPEFYRELSKKLVQSYLLDSFNKSLVFPKIDAVSELKSLKSFDFSKTKSEGVGTEYRYLSPKLQGKCRMVNEEIIYVNLFPRKEEIFNRVEDLFYSEEN